MKEGTVMDQRPVGAIRWERRSKPGGDDRWLARLEPRDARTFRRLVLPLVPRIERSIGPGSYAVRAAADGRLRPWPGARSAWRGAIRAFDAWRRGLAELGLEAHDGKTRMFTDIGEALFAIGTSGGSDVRHGDHGIIPEP